MLVVARLAVVVIICWSAAASAQEPVPTAETPGAETAVPAETPGAETAVPAETTGADSSCPADLDLLNVRLTALEEQLRALGIRLAAAEATQGDAATRLDALEGQYVGLTEALTAGSETHDGFLLRFVLGVGYVAVRNEESEEAEFPGTTPAETLHLAGGGLTISVGGSLTEHFHMYGELSANYPQIFAFGLGMGGYFADNWFLDAAVGYQLYVAGYGAVTVGKEWWVGPQWGTGVALRGIVYGGPITAGDLGTMWTLNWTATYN